MHLTVVTWNEQIVNIQVDPDTTVADVKAILEAETQAPSNQQVLFFGTVKLQDGSKLSDHQIGDDDVLQLMFDMRQSHIQQQQQQQQQQQSRPAQDPTTMLNADGSAANPIAFIRHFKTNPQLMNNLQTHNPTFARLIHDEDVAGVQDELRKLRRVELARQEQLRQEQELLEADPFNPEIQQKIEALIQQKNIEENFMQAMEHAPEVFATVEMLYVPMEINGMAAPAFIDSGAQITIMTIAFAEKCNLTRLLDKRFAGMAVGVGQSKIIGRIHQAPLKVAGQFIMSSITVLEQKGGPQFIFGLDNLKRHQCSIDLKRNVLAIGSCNVDVAFLHEHEIPRDFQQMVEDATRHATTGTTIDAAGGNVVVQPAPAAQPPATAAQPPASNTLDSKVTQLMQLGFSQEQCLQALEAANGNEDMAASLLTFGE